jgi:hypothetical protein
MAYSSTFPYTGSDSLYVKPVSPGSLPNNSPNWGNDSINSSSAGFGAVVFTGLTDGQVYWVFAQIGGSKASTDILLGIISPSSDVSSISSQISSLSSEVEKIPRASGSITPGAPFRRRKNSADETNFVEYLEPE